MANWRRVLSGTQLLFPFEQAVIANYIEEHQDVEAVVENNLGSQKDEYEVAGFFARYVAASLAKSGNWNKGYETTQIITSRIHEARKAEAEVRKVQAEAMKAEAAAQKAEAAAQKAKAERIHAAQKAEAELTHAAQKAEAELTHAAQKAEAEVRKIHAEADLLNAQAESEKAKAEAIRGAWKLSLAIMEECLPKEENKCTLGREGSTKVWRRSVSEIRQMEGIQSTFPSFWEQNLDHIQENVLKQIVCNERDDEVKKQSYKLQTLFLCALAEAIAKVRGVVVTIKSLPPDTRVHEPGTAGYFRRPDGRFEIGSHKNLLELKSLDEVRAQRLIAEGRGQIVVGGNSILRQKVDLVSEVFGFVDSVIDPMSEAVTWLAAALDAQVVAEANLRAASQVNKDVNWRKDNCLRIRGCDGYKIGEQYLRVPSSRIHPVDESCINVIAVEHVTEMALVVSVLWEGEMWWLKMGPDEEERQRSLQAPVEDWERWFQTERDMLFRAQLSDKSAFPVVVQGFNRPAMLVKDVGISLEKRLLSSKMTPVEVYEMSKQLYGVLESCGKQGVIHGDVCLQNICYKDGVYSLIDWGLACGRGFSELAAMVDKVWPCLGVTIETPGIPNWEMSPNVCFFGVRPYEITHDLESLLYCCMKILNGNTLPWSDASVHGTEDEVLEIRNQTVPSFMKGPCCVFESLIVKLRGDHQPAEFKLEHSTKVPEANTQMLSSVCYVPS